MFGIRPTVRIGPKLPLPLLGRRDTFTLRYPTMGRCGFSAGFLVVLWMMFGLRPTVRIGVKPLLMLLGLKDGIMPQ